MFSTMKLVPIIIVATTLAHVVDVPITQDELVRRAPVFSPLARGSVTQKRSRTRKRKIAKATSNEKFFVRVFERLRDAVELLRRG